MSHQKRLLKSLSPLLRHYGGNKVWTIAGSPIRSRKCIIYRFKGPEGAPIIAVKEYRSDVVKSNAAETQFNALQMIAGHEPLEDPETDYFVPTDGEAQQVSRVAASWPIAYLPQFNAIAMGWIDAPSLMTELTTGKGADLTRPILTSALWLRGFHDLTPITDESMDTGLMMGRLAKRLKTSSKHHRSKLVSRALSEINNLAQHSMSAPQAYLHGDFTPSNILVGQDGAAGIDIWARRKAPVYEDIARMLAYLGATGSGILGSRPVVRDFGQICADYVAAYDYPGADVSSDAFRFTLIYQLLRRWLVVANWTQYRQPPLRAKFKRRRLEACLQFVLDQ